MVHVNTTKTKFMSGLTCLSVECALTIVFRALVQQHDVLSAAGVCQEDVQHDALPFSKPPMTNEAGRKECGACIQIVRVEIWVFQTPRPESLPCRSREPHCTTLHKQKSKQKQMKTAERGWFDELYSCQRWSLHDQELEELCHIFHSSSEYVCVSVSSSFRCP